jgi:phosphoesterase RecJ-like protein
MSEKTAVKIPEAIVEGIRSAENVILLTHVHPDGDALGSSLGMAEILRGMGKEVCLFLEEPVSHLYEFLPGVDFVETQIEQVTQFARNATGSFITVALDSGDDRRLGKFCDELINLTPFVVIDHHKSHKDYGEHRWVDPSKSSTGEMIYELALELGEEISYAAAVNLYVAICTDTGSFRYECTRPRTLHIAAELVAKGVRPDEMARYLYDNVSPTRIRLLQMVLGTLQIYENGQLAFVHVTRDMIDKSGATIHDIEGFVDYPRSLGSVKVAAFIKESNDGLVSVSLRAKGDCDVAEVANIFDGGGHRNAAGFRMQGKTIDDVHAVVLAELRNSLNTEVE